MNKKINGLLGNIVLDNIDELARECYKLINSTCSLEEKKTLIIDLFHIHMNILTDDFDSIREDIVQ